MDDKNSSTFEPSDFSHAFECLKTLEKIMFTTGAYPVLHYLSYHYLRNKDLKILIPELHDGQLGIVLNLLEGNKFILRGAEEPNSTINVIRITNYGLERFNKFHDFMNEFGTTHKQMMEGK